MYQFVCFGNLREEDTLVLLIGGIAEIYKLAAIIKGNFVIFKEWKK